ncbi:DUF6538 domain-containing protein [Vibrio rarus]|uniref:DUF6538 domain-containing protein n=1 Tax=Vibrio rarus TaxID=413403 RepID=UPI0036F1C81A
MKYIQQRKQTYYFRLKLPQYLQFKFKNSEIVRSLNTDSYSMACYKVTKKLPAINSFLNMPLDLTNELEELFKELTDFSTIDQWTVSVPLQTIKRRTKKIQT